MRKFLIIALVLSLGCNAWLIWEEVVYQRNMEYGRALDRAMGAGVSDVTWGRGLQLFNDSLKKNFPDLAAKKYYYINIWALFCRPCIKEMPWLDTIVGGIQRKDVAYIFMAEHPHSTTKKVIDQHKLNLKNFVCMDNMGDFVSSIYNEQKKKSKVYPTVVIIDNKGKIYHSSTGAFENQAEAKEFKDLIEKLE